MPRSTPSTRVTGQSASKMAKKVAEKILDNPEPDKDASPEVIAALESVIGLLQSKARPGTELARTLDLVKEVVAKEKDK